MRCPTLAELPPFSSPGSSRMANGDIRQGWPWKEESLKLPDRGPDGSHWPRVSIVTPSYNQGEFIEETIRSVLLQGYPNLEYVIIDGGSDDNSTDVIKKYEAWLTCWISEPDRGQAHAINKGWSLSTGDILAWLNSDDLYAANALQHVVCHWIKAGRPNIVYGDCDIIDERGRFLGRKVVEKLSLEYLLSIRHLPQPAVFIARESLDTLGLVNENLNFALDFDYFLRAYVEKGIQFFHVPSIVAKSREYPATKSRSGCDLLAAERWSVLNSIFATNEGQRLGPEIRNRSFSLVLWRRALDRARMGRLIDSLVDAARSLTIYLKSQPLRTVPLRKAIRQYGSSLFRLRA